MKRSIAIAVVSLALSAGEAAADEPTEAEQAFNQGQAAFDAKQFDAAVTAWERSYALSKEPDLLFNLGQAYRARGLPGDCAKARDEYLAFLELEPHSELRDATTKFAAELESCAADDRNRTPTKPAVTVPPIEQPQVVEPTRAPSTNPGSGQRIAGIVVGAGGLALLATGLYFGDRARSLSDEVSDACATSCSWAVYASKDAAGIAAERNQWIFDGLGAAAIVAGGVLYVLGIQPSRSTQVAISPRVGGAALSWTGSW